MEIIGGSSIRVLTVSLSFALALVGCGSDPTTPNGGGGGGSDGPAEQHAVDSSGGSVSTAGGAVTLFFPTDALSEETTITVASAGSPPADPGYVPDAAYVFGPEGTRFEQRVQLTISYDLAKLPAGVAEEELRLAKVVEGFWFPVSGGTVDTEAHTVTGEITSFSSFGVHARVGVELAPCATRLNPGDVTTLNVTVPDAGDKTLVYVWTTAGRVGELGGGGERGTELESDEDMLVAYIAGVGLAGGDVVQVKVFEDNGGTRTFLGSAQSAIWVGVTDVTLIPLSATLEPDSEILLMLSVSPPFDDTITPRINWSHTANTAPFTIFGEPAECELTTFIYNVKYLSYACDSGYDDEVTARLYLSGSGGIGGGFSHHTIGEASSEITVSPMACEEDPPYREGWHSGCGSPFFNGTRFQPGDYITVSTDWTSSSGVCGESVYLWCARAVEVSGNFSGEPFSMSPLGVGDGDETLWSSAPGLAVILTEEHSGPVTFTLDPDMGNDCVEMTTYPSGDRSYNCPSVFLGKGGAFQWESARAFVVETP